MSIPLTTPALHAHWLHLQWQLRCALASTDGGLIDDYLASADELLRRHACDPVSTRLRTLQTLLRSAGDPTLPWRWRRLCLAYAPAAQARVVSLLHPHDPIALQAVDAAVQRCRNELYSPILDKCFPAPQLRACQR
ncbi:MAG: hypothetical protein REI94_17715 [Moraxellaceae bacterium]|nr:hypothetical protein [Moraxellaceae bacterium]